MTRLNVDCLIIIFNELESKEYFYPCLLVNKEWCNVAVPILWKKFALYLIRYDEKLFNTILSSLPPSSKQLLYDNDIKLPSTILLSPLLFNYISCCEFPNSGNIREIIAMVIGRYNNNRQKRTLLEQEIYKLFISQCKNLKEFKWVTSLPLSLFPGASECFSQLQYLRIEYLDSSNNDALYEMAQICKGLKGLIIYKCSSHEGLISLIDAQRNLRSVKIYDHGKKVSYKELSNALERKGSTIKDLYLETVSNIPTSLINLERVSIHNKFLNVEEINEFQQYLAIAEFPNLQNLTINGLPCFKEISLLIERTMGNVSMVDLYITNKAAGNTGMLIKAIANNCPKIRKLSTYLEPEDFIHVKLLLLNCRDLGSISFDGLNVNKNYNIGDELLDILTKFTSKSLTNLTISNKWKYSIGSLERFFESCRKRTLDCFWIIDDIDLYISTDYSPIVDKYMDERVIKRSNLSPFF